MVNHQQEHTPWKMAHAWKPMVMMNQVTKYVMASVSLPTRFPRIDHADMAVRLFQKRRQKQDQSQDYIEER
jgi:aromatic ring-opening dioxygenase catalytic subunit (LigB family)